MRNALLVWPEPQRGKPWGDGRKTGVSPHSSFQDAADLYEADLWWERNLEPPALATLQALSQECRLELSSHTSTIHEEATVQSQMPPGRAGTPNHGQIEERLLGHLADLPSQREPSFVPALLLGPRCLSAPGCTSNCVSLQGRHTHWCTLKHKIQSPGLFSDTLRSANVLRGAACFTTALPNPHKKQPPNPTTSSLHQSRGWEVRQHGRLLCAPEVCLSFPKQLPGLIRCLNKKKIKKKGKGRGTFFGRRRVGHAAPKHARQ